MYFSSFPSPPQNKTPKGLYALGVCFVVLEALISAGSPYFSSLVHGVFVNGWILIALLPQRERIRNERDSPAFISLK